MSYWFLPEKHRDEDLLEDEPFESDGDREPRTPKKPNFFGGVELEVPIEEEELTCAK